MFGFQSWLAYELEQRFAHLIGKTSRAAALAVFAHEQQVTPMLGGEAT